MEKNTKINIASLSPKTQATRVWQYLFDIYRSEKCCLNNMSDMLVDYTKLVEWFSKPFLGKKKLYWGHYGSDNDMTDLLEYHNGGSRVFEIINEDNSTIEIIHHP